MHAIFSVNLVSFDSKRLVLSNETYSAEVVVSNHVKHKTLLKLNSNKVWFEPKVPFLLIQTVPSWRSLFVSYGSYYYETHLTKINKMWKCWIPIIGHFMVILGYFSLQPMSRNHRFCCLFPKTQLSFRASPASVDTDTAELSVCQKCRWTDRWLFIFMW